MEYSLKDTIKAFLRENNLEEKIMQVRLKASWEKLVGKTISNDTIKLYLKNKKLYVSFGSAVIKDELSYAKSKMIQHLNQELGEEVINEIIIT